MMMNTMMMIGEEEEFDDEPKGRTADCSTVNDDFQEVMTLKITLILHLSREERNEKRHCHHVSRRARKLQV